MKRRGIGGYLGLEAGASRGWRPTGHGFQSARAALFSLLSSRRPGRVWVPAYICGAVPDAIDKAGILRIPYELDDRLCVPDGLKVEADDIVLCVNYFGLCEEAVDRSIVAYGADRIVVDDAQALFSPPRECLGTIYSPRKFVGVPDGGYLVTSARIALPATQDAGSLPRTQHLILRHAAGAEAGYAHFRAAEQSLADPAPMRMSRLTMRLLKSIDFARVSRRRLANYHAYQAQLGTINLLRLPARVDAAPLYYPFVTTCAGMSERLIARRIFVPSLWPESPFERHARAGQYLVPLPLDQRYGTATITEVAEAVRQEMGKA